MMKIHSTNQLRQSEKKEVLCLLEDCQRHDQMYRQPYLANTFNFDPQMPCFFLAYEGDALRGFLAVYADDVGEGPELSLYVSPSYRHQGIARSLYHAFCQATDKYQFPGHHFVSERVFLAKHPYLAENWQLTVHPDTEFQMLCPPLQQLPREKLDYQVTLATVADIDAIARFQAESFASSLETSRRYAEQAVSDRTCWLYLIKKGEEVIGSTSVDLSTDYHFFFGLAMRKDQRDKGLGTYFIQHVMADLTSKNPKPFQLYVEADNHVARKFYEKLGFTYQTEIVYLEKDI